MSSFFLVTVEDEKPELTESFLEALSTFARAIDSGAGYVTLRWSA
jgi:hypothetical protein